jgi:hypothetical protein
MISTSLLLAAVACAVVLLVAAVVFRRKRFLPGPEPIIGFGNVHQLDIERFHINLEDVRHFKFVFSVFLLALLRSANVGLKWAESYGNIYEFWTFGERRVVVSDIELTKKAYFGRPENFTRPDLLTNAFTQMQTVGLFALEGETWKRHRRLMSPAFSKAAVNRMHHCINTPVGPFTLPPVTLYSRFPSSQFAFSYCESF